MYKITSDLIAGSAVSLGTHPILISLLELAAQPPAIERGMFPDAASWETFRKRVTRDWGGIAAAFRAACIAGITDAAIVAACPHQGLSFSAEDGWKLKPFEPDTYRKRVASLITQAVVVASGDEDRLSPGELAAVVLAFDKAIRAELALKKALAAVGYAVYAAGVMPHVRALQGTRASIKSDNR